MFTARLGKGLANGAAAADRQLLEKDHGDAQKAGALVLLRVEPEGNHGETQIQWKSPDGLVPLWKISEKFFMDDKWGTPKTVETVELAHPVPGGTPVF